MNEVIKNLMTRRSIRTFLPQQIKEEELQIILQAGLIAPSANNSQPWHLTVVQDQDILNWIVEKNKEKLRQSDDPEVVKRGMDEKSHNFYRAPSVIIVSADESRVYGRSDCGNLVTQMALAAHSLGIGSCYIASFMNAFRDGQMALLKEKLQVPEEFTPYFCLSLGYYDVPLPEPRPRKENSVNYLRAKN